jgi:hypothetical protein
MGIFLEVDLNIWYNFCIGHLDWITNDFEFKIQKKSGFEVDLKSKENLEILI